MSNLDDVKRQLASNADVSAEYIMKILGVTKPYAYNLLSKGRKELRMVKQRDGKWTHKIRMQSSNPVIVEQQPPAVIPVPEPKPDSALDVQVGGGHYKDMKIQPVEFITVNNLGFLEGCIVKRICRWKEKDGLKDLEKIKHEVDLLIELNKLK
jgi:hypothetical protein